LRSFLDEGQQIQLFTTVLGEPLRTDVALKQPRSLEVVVMFTCAYEQTGGTGGHDAGH
jgi:hypothetical protein